MFTMKKKMASYVHWTNLKLFSYYTRKEEDARMFSIKKKKREEKDKNKEKI